MGEGSARSPFLSLHLALFLGQPKEKGWTITFSKYFWTSSASVVQISLQFTNLQFYKSFHKVNQQLWIMILNLWRIYFADSDLSGKWALLGLGPTINLKIQRYCMCLCVQNASISQVHAIFLMTKEIQVRSRLAPAVSCTKMTWF